MALPTHLAAHLAEAGLNVSGSDQSCQGAEFHSPTPLAIYPVPLMVSPPKPGEKVPEGTPVAWLCGSCRDNFRVLVHLLQRSNGALDWPVRREFGNKVRALALRAWDRR